MCVCMTWRPNKESSLSPLLSEVRHPFTGCEGVSPPLTWIKHILISLFSYFSPKDIMATAKDFYRLNRIILKSQTWHLFQWQHWSYSRHLVISHRWMPSSSIEIKGSSSMSILLSIIPGLRGKATTNVFRGAGAILTKSFLNTLEKIVSS